MGSADAIGLFSEQETNIKEKNNAAEIRFVMKCPPTSILPFEFLDDLRRGSASPFHLADLKADSADFGVATAAVALANGGEIVLQRFRDPRVRANGNLGPEGRVAHGYRVCGIREKIIRDEFV